jgi:hypothetical protein
MCDEHDNLISTEGSVEKLKRNPPKAVLIGEKQ